MPAQPTAKWVICPCVGTVLKLLKTFSMLTASADHPCQDPGNSSFYRNQPCEQDLERSTMPHAVCRHQLKEGKLLWSFQYTWLSLPTSAANPLGWIFTVPPAAPGEVFSPCPPFFLHTHMCREQSSMTAPIMVFAVRTLLQWS